MVLRVNAYTHKLAMLNSFTMNYHLDIFRAVLVVMVSWMEIFGRDVATPEFALIVRKFRGG